jgi:DNA-binding CsgD family transcriptional regulator
MLVGRDGERARLDGLIAEAAAGRGGAIAFVGEPGIGKTALLEYARAAARAGTVVATTGVESEFELPFAGLVDVIRPLLGHLPEIPGPQADLLRTALAFGPPRPVDRLAAGASVLSLLAAAAGDGMLLALVDDAHWLDVASRDALLFAARRLGRDPIAVIFAAREGEPSPFEAFGIETVRLSGLGRDEAARVLGDSIPPAAVDTLFELTRGNPLALLELPGTLGDEQLLGRAPPEQPVRVSAGIERAFAHRAVVLGEAVGRALLVAAADDTRNLEVVTAAVAALGGSGDELVVAEDAGLLRIDGPRIEFRHPLVRAAVYQRAAPSERRDAHRTLAASLDGRDAFRHAWHSGAAATGYDAEAAQALASAATASRARGGYSAAAAAFEVAARLTPEPGRRPALLASAADAAWLAGRDVRAGALIEEGLASDPSPAARAELLALRGRIGLYADDQETAYDTLLEAARLIEDVDPTRAGEFLVEAIGAGLQLGGAAATRAAARLEPTGGGGGPLGELLTAQALLSAASILGDPSGRERLDQALVAIEADGALDGSALRLFWAGRGRFMLGQNDQAAALARRALDRAREDAALVVVPQALRLVAAADFERGRWRTAYAAAGEAVEVGRELGQSSTVCACFALLAEIDSAGGNEEACRAHASAAIEIAGEKGFGFYREWAERALGRLELVHGRTRAAIDQLVRVQGRLERAGNWEQNGTPAWDLVEAYARLGATREARDILARAEVATPPASPAEEAVIERCRGIVADDESHEAAFERALVLHDAELIPFERARSEFVYGERLRRCGQRRRARERLHSALNAFSELGATGWERRAWSELIATGERLRSTTDARESLTVRETQVALAVAEGASNREVAAALFLTPKTVEYHLTRVYRKLGLRSRADLVRWALTS